MFAPPPMTPPPPSMGQHSNLLVNGDSRLDAANHQKRSNISGLCPKPPSWYAARSFPVGGLLTAHNNRPSSQVGLGGLVEGSHSWTYGCTERANACGAGDAAPTQDPVGAQQLHCTGML